MTDDDTPNLTNAILFADANRGVFIPQHFARAIARNVVTGVSDEDYLILAAGPDHDQYWDVWNDVLDRAQVTAPDLKGQPAQFYLWQDGDLWFVPVVNT